jgi:hypothetical protein
VKSNENAISFKDNKITAHLSRKYESGSVQQALLFVAATRYVYPKHALTTPVFAAVDCVLNDL